MKEYICCFTGHRIVRKNEFNSIKVKLKEAISQLIEKNIIIFLCGGALGFDTLAALEVLEQKKEIKIFN